MSGASDHMSGSRKLTAVLGAILLLAEIPIQLMEHTHFLHALETHFPQFYALLVSPTVTIARWIVGGLLVLWVIYEYRNQRTNMRPAEPPAAPAFQAAAHPQQTINFNPVIQNIQNVGPVGAPQEATQPAPPRQLPPQPRPNLIFLHTRVVPITFENAPGEEFFYESRIQDRDDPRAVLACFRNEPADDRAVIDADLVRAQLIYRNHAGQEIGLGIARACWLNENADMVDFRVSDSHCAILITKRADGQLLMPGMRRVRSQDGYGDVVDLQIQPVNEEISTIEIRVLDGQNRMLARRVFNFADEDGQLRIVEQPVPA